MPHVVLVTSSYPDGTPGSEAAGSFVADFARELSTKVRVTILAASAANSVTADGALMVRRFAVPRIPLSLLNAFNPLDWLAIVRTLRSGKTALRLVAADDCPDHVLALWALPSGYWAESINKQYGVPFSIWALGSDIWGLGKIPLVRSILRNILGRATHRFADGLKLATDVESICHKPCDFLPSTRQMPRSNSRTLPTEPPYKLAFLGRWHVNKGIDLLLDALSQLSCSDWQNISEVRIFGGAPLSDQVLRSTQELRERGRPVSLGGYLDKPDAANLIQWADYLLLPSRIESIPVIFSDAMQMGTPLIATPAGDLPRLFKKFRFGILASEISTSAYVGAIRSALSRNASLFLTSIDAATAEFNLQAITRDFLETINIGGKT